MFKTTINWAAQAAYLTSDRLLDVSYDHWLELSCNQQTYAWNQAIYDYQPYINTTLRDNDVNFVAKQTLNKDGDLSIHDLLSQQAIYFLEWKGNCFEVKSERLHEWLSFVALVDPSWIIASAYIDLFHTDVLSISELIECVVKHQCMTALSIDPSSRCYADNHVHLGGHGHAGPSLLNFALYLRKAPDKDKIKWPRRIEYTLFESGKLDKHNLPVWMAEIADRLGSAIFNPTTRYESFEFDQLHYLKHDVLAYISNQQFDTNAQRLIGASHYHQSLSPTRWILFCTGLLLAESSEKQTGFLRDLSLFIRCANILRNYMTVSGVGLSQFVSYFSFKHRKVTNGAQGLHVAVDGLKHDFSPVTHREFRVSPSVAIGKYKSLNPVDLESFLKLLKREKKSDNAHFVLHFSRSYPNKSKPYDRLLEEYRTELYRQVEQLQILAGSMTYQDRQLDDINEGEHYQHSIDIRKAIRGFDVAGDETQLPIEVFAPALRVLRSAKHVLRSLFGTRYHRPFLTVHAGEDYSHLLSGLRTIDETVQFCKFSDGDRLGHALALGINPKQWAKRQQTAYLTIGEHLDNLVWCHHQALKLIRHHQAFVSVVSLLEQKIEYWSQFIYSKAYTISELYQSWLLRRNCPRVLGVTPYDLYRENGHDEIKHFVQPENSTWQDWIVDHHLLTEEIINKNPVELWMTYLYDSLSSDSKNKRYEPIMIYCNGNEQDHLYGRTNHGNYFDSVTAGELDLFQAIQDLLMEEYSRKGIIIEACPTSNLYIGRFKYYHEHPIFRWNPPVAEWLSDGAKFNRFGIRKGAVPVCINTDDCALMPTTIHNEHRVMKTAAIDHFDVGSCQAEDWIDRIRQKGVDIFKANHLEWIND